MTTILAYTRVSSDGQSVEAQRHAIGQRYKISDDGWFTDEATSGTTKALERTGFKALFTFARKGDTVIVAAIDRLGRNTIDVLETVEALKAKGVTVVSMREGFDLSTPTGKLMLTLLAGVAELERENIKARQMAGIEKAGRTVASWAPPSSTTTPLSLPGERRTAQASRPLPTTGASLRPP